MTKRPICAITFDLWDTVFVDDSDEPKRAAQGLPPKWVERRQLVHRFLEKHAPASRELVNVAYDTVDACFHKAWREQHITWTVRERLSVLLVGLGRSLPESDMAELVRLHEEMELRVRPKLAPGVREALVELQGTYRLGVVSDVVFSPGWALRRMLADEGLLELFDVLIFSDEVGCSKPAPAVFEAAAAALGLEPSDLVHVGDREQRDVAGPHAAGARAVLLTVVRSQGSETSMADAICGDYRNLASTIEKMDSQ